MQKITVADKQAGDQRTAAEDNQVKLVVNHNADEMAANTAAVAEHTAAIAANTTAIALRVQIGDIVNTLDSDLTNKPLSAAQGKALKGFIDTINAALLSDNTSLDSLQEIVDFIELNKDSLDNLTIGNIAGLTSALAAKLDTATFNIHTSDTDNPHAVTKDQVGLGNADNTSDADKPVSTLQATAIGAKLAKSTGLNALLIKTQAEYDALTPDANTLYIIKE